MGHLVEGTTFSIHDSHSEYESLVNPGEEFEFHPWLASRIRDRIGMPDSILRLQEISCDEVSCPVTETRVEVLRGQTLEPLYLFRFGRRKEQISKLDFQLSFERQKKLS